MNLQASLDRQTEKKKKKRKISKETSNQQDLIKGNIDQRSFLKKGLQLIRFINFFTYL